MIPAAPRILAGGWSRSGARRLSVAWALAVAIASPAAAHAAIAPAPPPANPDRAGARDTARAGIRYLYLVRHGWYNANDPRDPRVGMEIDSLGRAQARLTGERLAHLPIRVGSLVSSTYTRAMQTADLIGEALHVRAVRDSELSECSPPSYRPDYYRVDDPAARERCAARLARAWARYVRPAGGRDDAYDVLVCHGNVIRWFASRALHLDAQRWPDYDIGNCSITVIAVHSDGSTRLAAFSDTGHLPAAMQTWTGRGAGWSPPDPPMPPVLGGRRHGRGLMAPAPEASYDTLRTAPRPHDR